MTIDHIVEAGHLVIEPLLDPLEQPWWMRTDSNDLLTYVTPYLGPSATLMVHRFATYFTAGDVWLDFELPDLAQTFGLGHTGINSPLMRTIGRIHRFGFGQIAGSRTHLAIRTAIPPISRRHAERIPSYLTDICPYIIR